MKLGFSVFLILLLANTPWKLEDYENITIESFYTRTDVNQKIDSENFDSKLLEAAVFYATNEVRVKKKKSSFSFDAILLKSAQIHSSQMEKFNFFDHTNRKNRKLKNLSQRIAKAGGDFAAYGENIARVPIYDLGKKGTYFVNKQGEIVNKQGEPLRTKTYKDLAIDVVDEWMHSKGHRENILRDYTLLGCGVSNLIPNKDGISEILITQNFGKK